MTFYEFFGMMGATAAISFFSSYPIRQIVRIFSHIGEYHPKI